MYAQTKVAEGNFQTLNAQAKGLEELIKAAGGVENLTKYLLVDRHVLEKLAEQQAEAVKGMNPNINIWNTGEPDSKASGALADLLKSGMPLLDGIKQQTGYDFLGSVGVKKD